jgi:beta-barrel assembly-enhancing protease
MKTGKSTPLLRKYVRQCVILCATVALHSSLAFAATPAASDEEKVGDAAAAKLLGSMKVMQNPSAQTYINTLGASLAALTVRPTLSWRFVIVDSNDLNAFAAPGGIVMVTKGLLKILDSEDELAAVLSHEIMHVVRKHHYNVIVRQRLADELTQKMAASEKNQSMNELSNVSSVIYARGLDKSAEFEADFQGIQLLAKAGYDPSALISVLEKLGKIQDNDSRAELLFATHPSPIARLDQIARTNIETLPTASPSDVRKARFQFTKTKL